jgi:hypothetical protein
MNVERWLEDNELFVGVFGTCDPKYSAGVYLSGWEDDDDVHFVEYAWSDFAKTMNQRYGAVDKFKRVDTNGDVWRPRGAVDQPVVYVRFRGGLFTLGIEKSRKRLYDWIERLVAAGFVYEKTPLSPVEVELARECGIRRKFHHRLVQKHR